MYTPLFRPQPFGPVTVTTPGTPVALSSEMVTSGVCLATDKLPVNKISIAPLPTAHSGAGNTGNVYIGFAGMLRATLFNVIAVLTPTGAAFPITNNMGSNTYDFSTYLVDADNAGDGVYGSTDQN